MSAEIEALYKNSPAVLWVEDPETRAWLEAVWLGLRPTIELLVGAGRANVTAVCALAKESGLKHVFGLVDRDFG